MPPPLHPPPLPPTPTLSPGDLGIDSHPPKRERFPGELATITPSCALTTRRTHHLILHRTPNAQRRNNCITPVTIFQLKSAEKNSDDAFYIDGKDCGQIVVMGVVREVDVKSTKMSVNLEDHTGIIDVIQWLDDEPAATSECREGMYVKAVGHVKALANGNKNVTAFKVSPVTDYNEITHHLLACLQTHLVNTQGQKNVSLRCYSLPSHSHRATFAPPIAGVARPLCPTPKSFAHTERCGSLLTSVAPCGHT